MKIIKHSDIEALDISPLQYMEWVNEALLNQYNCIIPPKISIPLPNDGFFNTMPCYIPFADTMGLKVVNRYLTKKPSLDATIMLYEASSGDLRAMIDATLITSMRTGAVAAASIIALRKVAQETKISILGLGATARATMLCLLESLPGEIFDITLLQYKNQAEEFIERFSNYNNVRFNIATNYHELIQDADIIISAISSANKQIGEDEWFKEGVLLVPIHTRGFQNCDLFFDKIYGDVTGQIEHFKNFNKFKHFEEFARVIRGEANGRENNNERILVYNIGQALHDIYIADKMIDMFDTKKLMDIEVKESMSKFYI